MNREEQIKAELKKTKNYIKYNRWSNSRTNYGYHSFNIAEINIEGQRNPKKRLELMKKHIEFNDKNVVDFGCNVGAMLFHLPEIKKGIGFDFDDNCIKAADNIKVILGYSNMHFYTFDFDKDDFKILRDTINFKPDIIFVLSIGAWIKNIIKLYEYCIELGGIIVLETNNDEIGKRDLDFFKNHKIELIINNSEDDSTPDNKLYRKTYLIS